MSETRIIFINGIFTLPGRRDAWTDMAVEWFSGIPGVSPLSYEYLSGAIFRRGICPWHDLQRERAIELAAMVNRAKRDGCRVVLVGHSNGCQLIAHLVSDMELAADSVHLFAPAAFERDFIKAIDNEVVQSVFTYGSRRDIPLRYFATISRIITLGLSGYGSLGIKCRELAEKRPTTCFDFSNDNFGHSSWFDIENFDGTMRLIANNIGITKP